MHWFKLALSRYAVFSGRSQRSEFWFFALFSSLIQLGLYLVDSMLGWTFMADGLEYGALSTIALLALLVPGLSVSARRLHDIGKSGWWQLLILLPFLGVIVLIYFWARDGQAGQNAYGDNPKSLSAH